jgi:hypothetical protein
MNQRRDFFAYDTSEEELKLQSESTSADDRWLAAIQLGQTHTVSAAKLLWVLKEDSDESTRIAATMSLRNFPVEILRSMELDKLAGDLTFEPTQWKVRPLPKYGADSKDLYSAAMVAIVSSEGPSSGNRIFRLLSQAAAAGGAYHPTRTQVRDIALALVEYRALSRVDKHFDNPLLEHLIVTIPGLPEVFIRDRFGREIADIPINEAQEVLRADSRFMRRPSPDMGWEVLMRHYDIKPNEFHLVGEALEGPWQGLFLLA